MVLTEPWFKKIAKDVANKKSRLQLNLNNKITAKATQVKVNIVPQFAFKLFLHDGYAHCHTNGVSH